MSEAKEQTETRLIVPAMDPLYRALSGFSYPMIRFFTGLILVPHGAQKLFGWFGGGGLQATAQGFGQNLGLEPGIFWASVVALNEFVGGLCIAFGFLTRIFAAGLFIEMAMTIILVHLSKGFFWGAGGYEYPLLWGLIGLAIFFRGGGNLSVDRAIGREF
ncbi:MAG TPA: DoxX family protein [Kiloniellales bacterium]|nr:DoxX family protein [Kiloniellales bacterium]